MIFRPCVFHGWKLLFVLLSTNTWRQNETLKTKNDVRSTEEEIHHSKETGLAVYILCNLISILCIGYLFLIIHRTIISLKKIEDIHGFFIEERTNNSTKRNLISYDELKKENMISHVKVIVILYLKNIFNLLIIAGIMEAAHVVFNFVLVEASYHSFITWILFGMLNFNMAIIVLQSLSVHCFYGILDKFPYLHTKLSRMLNWNTEWDVLFKEEMNKPAIEMLAVCKAFKILQWVIYFAITTIVVLCISKVPRYCNDI